MKKFRIFIGFLLISFVLFLTVNFPVSTKQGVNGVIRTRNIPLIIKVMEFFCRDYHYRRLVREIVPGNASGEEAATFLFKWTSENIRKVPQGFPLIDDHVFDIIIRGYGAEDQSSDVFSTLCNYAGIRASYGWLDSAEGPDKIAVSFVKIGAKWYVFDSYNAVFFKKEDGNLATVGNIIQGEYSMHTLPGFLSPKINYNDYIQSITPEILERSFSRSVIQSPSKRLFYEVKKWLKIN